MRSFSPGTVATIALLKSAPMVLSVVLFVVLSAGPWVHPPKLSDAVQARHFKIFT